MTLNDIHPRVRQSGAEALGKIGDSQAVEPLIALLKDTSSSVRGNAAFSLGQLGDKRAIPDLRWLSQNDDSETSEGEPIRYIATTAIANIEGSNG